MHAIEQKWQEVLSEVYSIVKHEDEAAIICASIKQMQVVKASIRDIEKYLQLFKNVLEEMSE